MTPVICTVDVVLLTLFEGELHVGLLKREREPFEGVFSLPGGFVHAEEDSELRESALRVLKQKAGIARTYIEQLGTFSGPARDPRGWSLSVAYYALVSEEVVRAPVAEGRIKLFPVAGLKALPFDHLSIVQRAVARLRSKSSYSSLPVYLCGERFTLPQLQAVYEALLGEPINKVSFRRKMDELDMVEAIDGALEQGKANRPAQLYQLRAQFKTELSLTDRAFNA